MHSGLDAPFWRSSVVNPDIAGGIILYMPSGILLEGLEKIARKTDIWNTLVSLVPCDPTWKIMS